VNKKLIVTLVIIALTVIVLLLNMGGSRVTVEFYFTAWKTVPAFAYLFFIAVGTLIGVMLK